MSSEACIRAAVADPKLTSLKELYCNARCDWRAAWGKKNEPELVGKLAGGQSGELERSKHSLTRHELHPPGHPFFYLVSKPQSHPFPYNDLNVVSANRAVYMAPEASLDTSETASIPQARQARRSRARGLRSSSGWSVFSHPAQADPNVDILTALHADVDASNVTKRGRFVPDASRLIVTAPMLTTPATLHLRNYHPVTNLQKQFRRARMT